jgi:hypothetical protein
MTNTCRKRESRQERRARPQLPGSLLDSKFVGQIESFQFVGQVACFVFRDSAFVVRASGVGFGVWVWGFGFQGSGIGPLPCLTLRAQY